MPALDQFLAQGNSLDDIDEYGFTPLIETAITRQPQIAAEIIKRGVDINKPDITGRAPLHWAVDNHDIPLVKLLLKHQANPNAYTRSGLSVLVYPLLRGQNALKHLLYQYGAKLDFALDFIYAKLLGHRFELQGDVDIINAQGEFIELDYEGFILEFTLAVLTDSLRRFTSSYSTKAFRPYFPILHKIIDAFVLAEELLKLQHHVTLSPQDKMHIQHWLKTPLLILPAASRGHAFSFIRHREFWAKIDRGENSLKEGSVNIYRITKPEALTVEFIQSFLFQKQSRSFFHQTVNSILGLHPVAKIPMTAQITGNCSWANVQAVVPVAYALSQLADTGQFDEAHVLKMSDAWVQWDQDRAIDECIQRFYQVDPARKASIASTLAAILFQAFDHASAHDMARAEKILTLLMLPEYYYILKSYLEVYCIRRLTREGNNLLKILDDCGINPNIGVNFVATGLEEREKR